MAEGRYTDADKVQPQGFGMTVRRDAMRIPEKDTVLWLQEDTLLCGKGRNSGFTESVWNRAVWLQEDAQSRTPRYPYSRC